MSVITYHEVSGNNIFDRLKSEGVIHEGDIYSPNRKEYIHFDSVFDYTLCNDETLQELESRQVERDEFFKNQVNSDSSLTNEQKTEKLNNHNKCDYHLLPVYKADNGGVFWTMNYWSDDLPSVAIGRRYPDEIFDYFQETEGHLDVSCKFKGGQDVTADGRPYEDALFKISDKLIKKIDDKRSCVLLYVDTTDKRPARLYCDTADIAPIDYTNSDGWHSNYKNIVIRDKNKDLTLYRVLSDGTKSKESWSVDDLKSAMEKTKNDYKKMKNDYSNKVNDMTTSVEPDNGTSNDVELG